MLYGVVEPWNPYKTIDFYLYPSLRTSARARGLGSMVEGLPRMLEVLSSIPVTRKTKPNKNTAQIDVSDSWVPGVMLPHRLEGRLLRPSLFQPIPVGVTDPLCFHSFSLRAETWLPRGNTQAHQFRWTSDILHYPTAP